MNANKIALVIIETVTVNSLQSFVMSRARNTNSSTTGAIIKIDKTNATILFSISSDIPPVNSCGIGATDYRIFEDAEKQNAANSGNKYSLREVNLNPYVFCIFIFFIFKISMASMKYNACAIPLISTTCSMLSLNTIMATDDIIPTLKTNARVISILLPIHLNFIEYPQKFL